MTQHPTLEMKGETYVLVPKAEFNTMAAALDDKLDARAARRALAELEGREADLLTTQDLARIKKQGPLRFWRDRRAMKAIELADKAGITQPYLSEIETGKKDGGLKVMAKIAAILGVSLDDLVFLD